MARSFDELRNRMSPERRKRNDEAVEREVRLYDLRVALEKTQAEIADAIGTYQSNVSKIENRNDLLVSTLRRYLNALGASLIIKAAFDEFEIDLSGLFDADQNDGDQSSPDQGSATGTAHA